MHERKDFLTKEFFQFVFPSVAAFALSGVYTIVDGFFIGRSLGDNGLAAINIGFPISAFIQAAGTGIGLSGAIRFTILKGQDRHESASECFNASLLLLAAASLIFSFLFYALCPKLVGLMGAKGEIYYLTEEYVRIIALGAAFQLFATGLTPFIRNLGGSVFAMLSMTAGFLTNIVLDYAFVWLMGMGMSGAALATIIGQAATLLLAVIYIRYKRLKLSLAHPSRIFSFAGSVIKMSLAPFGLTFSPQITTLLMNYFLSKNGSPNSVAVYGCIAYITAIAYLLLQGVGDGSQPLISKYFGKAEYKNMNSVLRLSYITGAAVAFLCALVFFMLRSRIGVIFGASSDTNAQVASYLPLFLSSLIFLSYVRVTTAFFYGTEKSLNSYILVYAEPLFLLILLLTMPGIFSLYGGASVSFNELSSLAEASLVTTDPLSVNAAVSASQIPAGEKAIWFCVPLAQLITCIIAAAVKRRSQL